MTVHAYYDEDDRQLMVGCCDGAHEVLYPLDDPEAVTRLLDALVEAGVLERHVFTGGPTHYETRRWPK